MTSRSARRPIERLLLLLLLLLATCGRTTDPPADGPRDRTMPEHAAQESFPVDTGPGGGADAGAIGQAGRVCPMECIREVICCRTDCTGPVVSRGCCSCLPGEVDSIHCPAERRCGP